MTHPAEPEQRYIITESQLSIMEDAAEWEHEDANIAKVRQHPYNPIKTPIDNDITYVKCSTYNGIVVRGIEMCPWCIAKDTSAQKWIADVLKEMESMGDDLHKLREKHNIQTNTDSLCLNHRIDQAIALLKKELPQ